MQSEEFERFLSTLSAAEIHLSSYNHFILHELPLLVQNFSVLPTEENSFCRLEFYGAFVPRACALKNGVYRPISPLICRRENLSYMSPVFASVRQTKYDEHGAELESQTMKRVVIAHVPVMLGSCICHTSFSREIKGLESSTDDGGYFLINGVERVLVTQRRKCYNLPQALEHDGVFSVNMRSISKETNHSVLIDLFLAADADDSQIHCLIPYVSKKVPIAILARAFGVPLAQFWADIGVAHNGDKELTEEDALDYIGSFASKKSAPVAEELEDVYAEESDDSAEVLDEEDDENWETSSEQSRLSAADVAKLSLRKTQMRYAKQIIDIELFPHLGIDAPLEVRYQTLCSMARKLVLTKRGELGPENRDNLMFQRFEPAGILLCEIYGMFLRNFLNTSKENGKIGAITDFTNKLEAFITKNIKSCMATGKWGIQKGSYVRQGVSQVLARFSVLGTRSHLQRLMLPVGKEGKNVKVRQIHPSQFGYIDLFETPEGQGCGIVLNFTAAVRISKDYQAPYIRDIVDKYCAATFFGEVTAPVGVWIDNAFYRQTARPRELVAHLRDLRARGVLPEHVSVYVCEDRAWRVREIRVLSEKGRVLRPVLDPKGRVVYLDPGEIQNNYVAMFRAESAAADFYELHPILLLSICAGSIPFLDHMQSPRIVYESSMLKQAIGFFASNFPIRYDTSCEVLDYSQKCLLSTKVGRAFGMHDAPAGTNCIVAIMTWGSWNAEDCVILNKSAIERGLFSSTSYKTIIVEEYKPKTNDMRRFCMPPEKVRKSVYNYGLLDARGIVKKGSVVSKKDVVVGCVREVVRRGESKEVVEMDCSELANEKGIVEKVEIVETLTGNRIVTITLKVRKIPERGDKFANLNAQKGTCGLILPAHDMPFCAEDGMIPDLLVNPNALPSRMTISMFLEFVLGQEAALDGEFRDATPFEPRNLEGMGDVLIEHGYDALGWKTLIDGTTGRPLRAKIFMGVNYYQKLKHMVSNKLNARNFGNVTSSTRQPVSGRSKDGGIRAGEMEVQGWLSQGESDFIVEKLFECSDRFMVWICERCGVFSNHKDQCHLCNAELFETRLPYAAKTVFQLLQMCLIMTRFKVKAI
jgi:DNA-directed RNA polymerase II subunit RPB2